MDTATIVEHLDAEIFRLQQVRALLTDGDLRKAPVGLKLVTQFPSPSQSN
jgi:hypothetical protein